MLGQNPLKNKTELLKQKELVMVADSLLLLKLNELEADAVHATLEQQLLKKVNRKTTTKKKFP